MRLLWLTQNHPPRRGGMAESSDRIVSSIRRSGVPIDIVHFQSGSASLLLEEQGGGLIWRCPDTDDPEHLLNLAWNRIEAIAAPGRWTHVVAFGGILPLAAGPVYAAWLRLPLLTLFRGNDFDLGIFSPRRRAVVSDAVTRAAAVGAVSRDKVEKIRGFFPDSNAVWLPNGIDLDEWEACPVDTNRAEEWKRARVPEGRRVLGFFGQLKKKKGLCLFLEALRRSERADRFHLLVIGELEEGLESAIASIPALTTTLLPFSDRFELIPHYLACDFVALPSHYDGMPNVLLEAGALHVPCIASKIGGMADILADHQSGIIFDGGDLDAAILALRRAADLPEEDRTRLGRMLGERIASGYSLVAERDRYLELLKEISLGEEGVCYEQNDMAGTRLAGDPDRASGVRRQ